MVQLFVSAALALITWLALDASIVSNMTPGTFIAFFSAAGMLAKPVRQLSEINSQIQKGLAAAEDIFSQLDEKAERNDGTYTSEAVKGDITFTNLNFSYDTGEGGNTLEDINLTINQGETVAFVGKSGAGKTTLMSLLPRFYDGYEGDISIDDKSISEYEITNLRSHISLVSQNVTLFNDTIANNINYGSGEFDLNKIKEAAKKANADSFIELMADGYDTQTGDDGVLLSGGQRQRIAIARAILKDAPILILDEATSALDSESENYIQEALVELSRNKTTLVIAHRLSTIETADKIVVLDQGKIVEVGDHTSLIQNDDHYAELHRNQFKDDFKDEVNADVAEDLTVLQETEIDQISFIENSWYKKRLWLWILWPLSRLIEFLVKRRRNKYLQNLQLSWKPDIPLIVVGNIVVGGSGKTPFVIWLSKLLEDQGYKPGIVSRGYGSKSNQYPLIIDNDSRVADSGDEPLIIHRNTNRPVCVSPNRTEAVKKLLQETDADIIISDDGLQHYKLNRDIEIIVFDGLRGIGNNLCLPAGPLREPLERTKDADFIVSSTKRLEIDEIHEDCLMTYKPLEWVRLSDNKRFPANDWPLSRSVHAVAGIGNPSKFYSTLSSLGLNIMEHSFPDHYQFKEEDLDFEDNHPILMTEKDAVRCMDMNNKNLWYLSIEAEIKDGDFKEDLLSKVKAIGD